MNEWMSLLEAADRLGVHFHTVRRLARAGKLDERQIPWKGSATRYVCMYGRASVEAHLTLLNMQPPPPDEAEWMPIAEAQAILKMTRHGIKRRIKLGMLNALHQGSVGGVSLYVSRKQVEEQVLERPAYARRTGYDIDADEVEVIKLAGFFDGEGCVQISKGTPTQRIWVLYITIVNTYKPKIDKIQALFGGRVWKKRRDNPAFKNCWIWGATGDEAQSILKRMRPYLDVKHEQADLSIEFQDRLRSKRYGRWGQIPQEEMTWRDEANAQMSALNHRSSPDE